VTHPDDEVRALLTVAAQDLPGGPVGVDLPRLLVRARHRRQRRLLQTAGVLAGVLLAVGVPALLLGGHRPAPAPTAKLPGYLVPTVGAYPTGGPAGAAALAGGHWTALPPAPIAGRDGSTVAWTGSQMLIWGGTSADGEHMYADGAAYDPATDRWQTLPAAPLSARAGAASVWTGTELFVWGGNTDPTHVAADGALYDPATGTWRPVPPGPLSGRGYATALWTGSEVVVVGGIPADGTPRVGLDAAAYDPATGTWQRLPDVPVPDGRVADRLTAMATPDGVDAWVYWEHDVVTADGGSVDSGIAMLRYVPGSTAWQDVDVTQPKDLGTPLWTGRDLLFPATQPFYGLVPSPLVQGTAGWRMDPATGKLTRLPHGPVDDLNTASIWTGAALLSFDASVTSTGGPDGPAQPGEAAVWDPVSDTWTRLPDAPMAGAGSNAVWTGTHLIEWGLMCQAPCDSPGSTAAGLSFGP
jgi:N-acetylneuraminic acid mutarotase